MDLVFASSQIEHWPIERLRPYAGNAKIHGDDQVAKIAASMARFGWTVPCLVAVDGELIARHGRVLAGTQPGLTEVPVIRLGHLDEAERRAYALPSCESFTFMVHAVYPQVPPLRGLAPPHCGHGLPRHHRRTGRGCDHSAARECHAMDA